MKKLGVSFVAAVLLAAGSNVASAQSTDQCYKIAAILCGNEGLTPCMSRPNMMGQLPANCVPDIQPMVETARETEAELEQSGRNGSQDMTRTGMSYGGVLRSGPSMNHRRIASLREGDHLDVLEDTGVWFNDYKWFLVSTPQGTGYHWGGIFCVDDASRTDGIFSDC
ncbi:SH3 domain-containing protein [Aurantimonas sp. HBX-1]|uniref:SH3 domain-containing protein n=1 Tax=Aurantimonas sp. HBX-1 TaxID=2906072 RepID=UPI001F1BD179|nr:SH3 domain-containing protein [Aurantimonas sp. HBX-1]UIJ73792.1 SH3 domain-containing protein [Aurantimonas sp. HBX-1]